MLPSAAACSDAFAILAPFCFAVLPLTILFTALIPKSEMYSRATERCQWTGLGIFVFGFIMVFLALAIQEKWTEKPWFAPPDARVDDTICAGALVLGIATIVLLSTSFLLHVIAVRKSTAQGEPLFDEAQLANLETNSAQMGGTNEQPLYDSEENRVSDHKDGEFRIPPPVHAKFFKPAEFKAFVISLILAGFTATGFLASAHGSVGPWSEQGHILVGLGISSFIVLYAVLIVVNARVQRRAEERRERRPLGKPTSKMSWWKQEWLPNRQVSSDRPMKGRWIKPQNQPRFTRVGSDIWFILGIGYLCVVLGFWGVGPFRIPKHTTFYAHHIISFILAAFIIVYTVRYFGWKSRISGTRLQIGHEALRPGESTQMSLTAPPGKEFSRVALTLVCLETVSCQRGDRKARVREQALHEQSDIRSDGIHPMATTTMVVPRDAMHSFFSLDAEIAWYVEVSFESGGLGRKVLLFPIRVVPEVVK